MGKRVTGKNKVVEDGGGARVPVGAPDYNNQGREIEVPLLRALALGRKSSGEMQLLLDGEFQRSASKSGTMANCQMLALLLADLSVPEEKACITFKRVLEHQARMSAALGRKTGVKTAAMDYLEHIERALKIKDDENELTYTQLTQMAFTDQLTGLANYRFFAQRLRDEARRCERYGHLLSLLMIDLDHFKQFNDSNGHPAGNKALQQVSRALFAEVRDTDLLARYGGEEFALILPHTSKLEAAGLAERIRERVGQTRILNEGREVGALTLSVGLATLPRDARDEDALVNAADTALYRAKQSGRDRVCLYEPATRAHFVWRAAQGLRGAAVSVIGDFNEWKPGIDKLAPGAGGSFALDLPLSPGQYRYKFVLNEKDYVPDSANAHSEPDGYGGLNSVMTVK